MKEQIQFFGQKEYSRILDLHNARKKGLSQTDCEGILIDAGTSHEQAKNGAFVYLHHGDHQTASILGSQGEYDQMLDDFGAQNKSHKKCVEHLENKKYSYHQANSAVYKYRKNRNLIKK